MSSTRNRNSQSEHDLKVSSNKYIDNFIQYKYSTQPITTYFAGNGLLMPHIGRDQLSTHSIDHESFLFGIRSTDLVNSKPEFTPEIKNINSLNIAKRIPLIMPQPNDFNKNQRPLLYK
jgi:hypothetical protein